MKRKMLPIAVASRNNGDAVMKCPPALPYWLLLAVAASSIQPARAADPSEFALQIIPSTVEIPHGSEATVVIVLQNNTADPGDAAQLFHFTNPPLHVEIEPAQSRSIPAQGMLTWTARVSDTSLTAGAGNVHFRADFKIAAKEGAPPTIPVTAIGLLTVTSQPLQALSEVVEMKTETAIESVNSKRPGIIYLSLKNKIDVPVAVQSGNIRSPSWIGVHPFDSTWPQPSPSPGVTVTEAITTPFVLAPYESCIIGYAVNAGSKVTPGKQIVVFEVVFEWDKSGAHQRTVAVASQSIEVGVFGETAILAALGVPTFLFLPGFLIITTFGLLWKLSKNQEEKDGFSLTANTPEFYLVSITLSMLIFWVYPWATESSGRGRRDFTEAYGLEDVVVVWFGSILVGAIAFGIYRLIEWLFAVLRRIYAARYDFSPGDSPLEFIQKLQRRNLGLRFQRAPIGGVDTDNPFVIAEVPGVDGNSWVAPPIKMTAEKNASLAAGEVTTALDNGNWSEVVRLLEDAVYKNPATLVWEPSGAIRRPGIVTTSTIGEREVEESIIR